MIFIFKRKKINVDFFTLNPTAYEFCKISRATKFFPDWWKKLPKNNYLEDDIFPTPTMKSCVGFIDLYKNSYILPMWSDLAIEIGSREDGLFRWQFADKFSSAGQHGDEQYENFFDKKDYHAFKLNSPWIASTKFDINFLMSQPTYNLTNFKNYQIMPGIVNFKYQVGTNVNLILIPEENKKNFIIPFLQPLAFITPITDKELNFNHHLVDEKEIRQVRSKSSRFVFSNQYKKTKNLIDEKESRCPFGFK